MAQLTGGLSRVACQVQPDERSKLGTLAYHQSLAHKAPPPRGNGQHCLSAGFFLLSTCAIGRRILRMRLAPLRSINRIRRSAAGAVAVAPSPRRKGITRNTKKIAGDPKTVESRGDPKLDRLRSCVERLNRQQKKQKNGECAFMWLTGGDETVDLATETFSTGALGLDLAMGGGWPRGRILEVYGPEASGKTTLALHAVAELHKRGGTAAYLDVEHALSREIAEAIGVDWARMPLSQPSSAEGALDFVQEIIEEGAVDLVVVDSVAALTPLEEIDKDMGQSTVGLVARLMSKALRKLHGPAAKNNTSILFINQLRANIGGYGLSEITTGGNALKYYSSVRLEIRAPRSNFLKRPGGEVYGVTAKVKVVKNKCFPPHKHAEFDIISGQGISQESSIFDACVQHGLVKQKGAWYECADQALMFQGREKFVQHLTENKEVAKKLDAAVREKFFSDHAKPN